MKSGEISRFVNYGVITVRSGEDMRTAGSGRCAEPTLRQHARPPFFLVGNLAQFAYPCSFSFSLDLFSSMNDLISLAAPSKRFHCS
jgi:hypothetical protein